jgi:hypothetical protein
MSTILTSLTEIQFDVHVRPYLSTAQRGYESKIPLYKIFNYILYRLHTGCQWERLPIDPDPDNPEKKKSVITLFTIIFVSGVVMAASKSYGNPAL